MENFLYLIGGICIGWIITIAAVAFALALCRSAARQDPESDYYQKVG